MSTKRKTGGVSIQNLLARRVDMRPARDQIMLQMRIFRELLVAKEGTEDAWGQIAGMVNVFGLYAGEQKRADWLEVMAKAADALRSIGARHDRVGGRWSANEAETAALTAALNLIDIDIMPDMAMVDFVRLATLINRMAAEDAAAEA
jgi:hypothetical protein